MTVMLLQNARSLQHHKLQFFPTPQQQQLQHQQQQQQQLQQQRLKRANRMSSESNLNSACNKTAMRYYRIWIYTCNAVLLVSVVGFAIVAGKIIVADPKRFLIPGLSLYQPSFLYAYLALATQSGIIQVVGCLGALRLNEKLLNVYWLLLLVLLFGDALVGVVWVFRFDKICAELKPSLKQRLAAEYGVDKDFTTLWDALQRDFKCCGVESVNDFGMANRTATTVAANNNNNNNNPPSDWLWSDEAVTSGPMRDGAVVPESCCRYPSQLHDGTSKVPLTSALKLPYQQPTTPTENKSLSHVRGGGGGGGGEEVAEAEPVKQEPCNGERNVYNAGCEARLLLWLRQSADVLFVLGYCVIAFLKLCFLGILRYEIREMIQKIKILQGELRPPTLLFTDLENHPEATPLNSPTTPHLQPLLMNHRENGDVQNGPPPSRQQASRGVVATSAAAAAGEKRPNIHLLQPPDSLQTTPLHVPAKHHHLLNDGTDSDTNSSCALIVSDERTPDRRANKAKGSNGNNNYELHELQELNRLLSRHHTEI